MQHPGDISILDFTYDLPQEKIAAYPLEKRDESKLLIYKNGEIKEDRFKNIASFLEKDSILVFNTTRVVRARLNFFNEKGHVIEVFCLGPASESHEIAQAMARQKTARWNCLVGNLKRWKEKKLTITHKEITLHAEIKERNSLNVEIEFSWEPAALCFSDILQTMGAVPIPPYLKRDSEEIDQDRYQTIYADKEGSVAAPTAGLHFTEYVFEKLEEKSVQNLTVTLHVGAGTFKPVKSPTMSGHDMHAEWIDVEILTIKELLANEHKKIIPVGTTSLRTIETLYWMGLKAARNLKASLEDLEIRQWEVYTLKDSDISVKQSLQALLDWMALNRLEKLICRTQILIAPSYQLKTADGIITNFHQPQSTLLLLIGAVVGEKWRDIYDYALKHNFRFLSYGDSSLLLK